MSGDNQPWIDSWPMYEEAFSKFPVLADIVQARIKLARKFNRALPKYVEIELAWSEHTRQSGRKKSSRRALIGSAFTTAANTSLLSNSGVRGGTSSFATVTSTYAKTARPRCGSFTPPSTQRIFEYGQVYQTHTGRPRGRQRHRGRGRDYARQPAVDRETGRFQPRQVQVQAGGGDSQR